MSDMPEPRFMREGWSYFADGEDRLKPNAPQWAQEEFAQWKAMWDEVIEGGCLA